MPRPSDDQRAIETFWRNNGRYCISGLVSTLAGQYGFPFDKRASALAELCEKAFELSCPIDDYQEAAEQAGWKYRVSRMAGVPSFYHKEHGRILDSTWQDICEEFGIEPYQWEIFEHWVVDKWLAEKLEAKGERIDSDFEGLCVWGRTTTGQAVFLDSVICEIYDDLHAKD